MSALALAGDALTQWGSVTLATDTLAPTNAADPNLNLTLWSGIAGFLAPLLVALIQQPTWPPFVRALVALAASGGLAAVTTALEGRLTGERWVTSALLVAAAAIGTYQTLWKNVAPQLEAATSTGRHHAAP